MNEEKINKILFYLYNYENIDDLIEQRKNEIIDTVNISSIAWIKSKQGNGNTLEDQVIKLIDDPLILEYKRWQVFIKRILVFLSLYKPNIYKYVKLKFIENFENEELDNIVSLNDENGNEVKFEFLDLVELENEQYVVLLPVLEEGEEDDGEVVILRVEDSDEEEEESYVSVDDEDTLMKVFNIFKDKFKDEFDFVDDSE